MTQERLEGVLRHASSHGIGRHRVLRALVEADALDSDGIRGAEPGVAEWRV